MPAAVFVLTAFVTVCIVPLDAWGCPYSVRDVGFVDLDSPPYRIYLLVRDDTPDRETLAGAFKDASSTLLAHSNVEAEIVNLNEQKDHPALEHLRLRELAAPPAAILISPTGRSILLPIFDEKKPFKESVSASLEKVVASPTRDEIAKNIVKAWCVILLVQSHDAAENARAEEAVSEAMDDFAVLMSHEGKTAEERPYLILLPPNSVAGDEILLWSLGLLGGEVRGPHAVVLYGRGRQIGPVVEGESLTRNSLLHVMNTIGKDCGCDADQRWLSGTSIPMRWGRDLRQEVVKYLGFDPDNPIVKAAVSGIWSGAISSSDEEDEPFAYAEGEIADWEEVVGFDKMPPEGRRAGASGSRPGRGPASLLASEGASTLTGQVTKTALIVIGVISFFVLIGSAFVINRARHRGPP